MDSMVVMTRVPESDEVMNLVSSRNVARADMIQLSQEMSVSRSIVPYRADGRFQSRTI